MLLIGTDIAFHWLEREPSITARLKALGPPAALAAVSRAELENGVYRDPEWSATRRAALDIILSQVVTFDFAAAEIAPIARSWKRSAMRGRGCSTASSPRRRSPPGLNWPRSTVVISTTFPA